jgi:hypothetical protein
MKIQLKKNDVKYKRLLQYESLLLNDETINSFGEWGDLDTIQWILHNKTILPNHTDDLNRLETDYQKFIKQSNENNKR